MSEIEVRRFFDGLGMGIGYTMVLTAMAVVRELFGAGSLLGRQIVICLAAAAFLLLYFHFY
jgi:Na+-transporting NADH:ubiquinone oxidoreductase subunit D